MLNSVDINTKATTYFSELTAHFREQLADSLFTKDLPHWLQAATQLTTFVDCDSVKWLFTLPSGKDLTFTKALEWENSPECLLPYQKQADRLRTLVHSLADLCNSHDLPTRDGHARIVLKRHYLPRTTYEGVAEIPESRDIRVTIPHDWAAGMPRLVFIRPTQPCVQHALNVVYKELRESSKAPVGVAGYLEVVSRADLYKVLTCGASLDIPFMNPETRELQHAGRYSLAALTGYFDNVPVLPLSRRFFDRTPSPEVL